MKTTVTYDGVELSELEYLYDTVEPIWTHLQWEDAFKLRIKLGENLLVKLNQEHWSKYDHQRIGAVVAAIKFNSKLLGNKQ